MDDTQPQPGPPLPGIWICPDCGARLISRNLWHSCGQYSLESLFANADQRALDLARKYVALLYTLGDVQVIPQKTRLACVARVRFCGLKPASTGSWPASPYTGGLTAPALSRPSTMGRGGGLTTSTSAPTPTSTMN
jgi:hypothetical protein